MSQRVIVIKPDPDSAPNISPRCAPQSQALFRPWEATCALKADHTPATACALATASTSADIVTAGTSVLPFPVAVTPTHLPTRQQVSFLQQSSSESTDHHVPMEKIPLSSLGYDPLRLHLLTSPEASGCQSSPPADLQSKPMTPKAIRLMELWYRHNEDHPYASAAVIDYLASRGDITHAQVRKWMSNKRGRCSNTLPYHERFRSRQKRELCGCFLDKTQSTDSENLEEPEEPREPEGIPTKYTGRQIAIMLEWFEAHKDSPYPTKEENQELADKCRLRTRQVRRWFAAKRNWRSAARHRQPGHGESAQRACIRREARAVLEEWFQVHKDSPYPSEAEKEVLAEKCGLTTKQVRNWFANRRNYKPAH